MIGFADWNGYACRALYFDSNQLIFPDYPPLSLPSLPWKEAQRPAQPYRLVRLRPGPTPRRYHPLHSPVFLAADGDSLLSQLCYCEDDYYFF